MKQRVLFLEDEPEYFGPFIEALEKRYDLTRVEDLTEAVDVLSRERFDLLIIDVMLRQGSRKFSGVDSRRSGLHLIQLVRGEEFGQEIELKCQRDVPILVLTAVSDLGIEDDLEALDAPMVPKPFSKADVLERIATMLKEPPDVHCHGRQPA